MQIRRSSLIRFGDSLTRYMGAVSQEIPDVHYSLDYMHSRYDGKKVLTLISPETGGTLLLGHEDPLAPFTITVMPTRFSGEQLCWRANLPTPGIQGTQYLAYWIVGIFKILHYRDSDEQFRTKFTQYFEANEKTEFQFTMQRFETFSAYLYEI